MMMINLGLKLQEMLKYSYKIYNHPTKAYKYHMYLGIAVLTHEIMSNSTAKVEWFISMRRWELLWSLQKILKAT
jgi:hypothetical protein